MSVMFAPPLHGARVGTVNQPRRRTCGAVERLSSTALRARPTRTLFSSSVTSFDCARIGSDGRNWTPHAPPSIAPAATAAAASARAVTAGDRPPADPHRSSLRRIIRYPRGSAIMPAVAMGLQRTTGRASAFAAARALLATVVAPLVLAGCASANQDARLGW